MEPRKLCCAEHAAGLTACLYQFSRWIRRREAADDDPPIEDLRERWIRKWFRLGEW